MEDKESFWYDSYWFIKAENEELKARIKLLETTIQLLKEAQQDGVQRG